MILLHGALLIISGVATMALGLFLFYLFLPLFYFFFGLGVGYELGSFLTGTSTGEMSLVRFIFTCGGGVIFALGAYFLEPIRRILIGIGLGSLLGGLVANALGLAGVFGIVIMIVAAVIGAGLTLAVFDKFIIVASAFGGAGLAMDGTHQIFRSLDISDRATIVDGAVAPAVIWMVLSAIAVVWQFMNIERWRSYLR